MPAFVDVSLSIPKDIQEAEEKETSPIVAGMDFQGVCLGIKSVGCVVVAKLANPLPLG
jgi:hypothetical protein